jgi:hypothetical protein
MRPATRRCDDFPASGNRSNRGLGLLILATLFQSATATAERIYADGFEESCLVDTDDDRLSNCDEAMRGLSYHDNDTDDDGLKDGDEVLGTVDGLDLPTFGVDPRHKDILFEIDWAAEAFECPQHSHRPSDLVMGEIKTFYSLMPIPNPDSKPGVNYIADYGQGGIFTGGSFVETLDGVVSFTELVQTHWPVEFAINRRGYFRYSMHAHRWAYNSNSSGLGVEDYSLVTLRCFWDEDDLVRNTMIHEYGHNFGLGHGGNSVCNNKPNYNSVMNYNHQFPGLDIDCDGYGDGVDFVNYSGGERPPLNANSLIEADGVCGSGHPSQQWVDWNGNGQIDPQPVSSPLACTNSLGIVSDWNDIAALSLAPQYSASGANPPEVPGPEADPCPAPPIP